MICLLSRDAFRKEDYDTLRSESILFCVPPFSGFNCFCRLCYFTWEMSTPILSARLARSIERSFTIFSHQIRRWIQLSTLGCVLFSSKCGRPTLLHFYPCHFCTWPSFIIFSSPCLMLSAYSCFPILNSLLRTLPSRRDLAG